MRKKIQHLVLAISLLALVLAFIGQPVYAQPTVNTRADKAAYAPGDSGTMTISIINNIGSGLLLRNITIYYPWASYDTNGKWLQNANYTFNFSPNVALATRGTNNYTYTTTSFSIPTWWDTSGTGQFGCPGNNPTTRFGVWSGCILLGSNSTNRYDRTDLSLSMAAPFYNPSTLSSIQTWVPVATLVVLVIATAILAMVMLRLGNLSRKQ